MQAKHLLKFNNYRVTPTLPRANRNLLKVRLFSSFWNAAKRHDRIFPIKKILSLRSRMTNKSNRMTLPWRGKHSRYYYLILGSVLLLAGIAALTIVLNTKKAEAAWFNSNWGYRQAITVTVSTNSSDINNLETLLTITNTNTLISAGKLQTNCKDLRFTSQTGTLLPYYIDSGCNTASAKVWVLVDKVPANTTTYTLYMYYGNPSVIAGTNPTKFNLFNGLVGYWPMNEAVNGWNNTSQEVKDVSVNANNGTGVGYNGTQSPIAGKNGNAGVFVGGGSEYVTMSSVANQKPTGNFTISAWIKAPSYVGSMQIFQSFSAATHTSGIEFEIDADSNHAHKMELVSGNNTGATQGTNWQSVYSNTTVDDNNWHFLTGTWDGAYLNMYIDGMFENKVAWPNAPAYEATSYELIGYERDAPSTYNSGLSGNVDDLRLYNRALSAIEIQNLYSNPGTLAFYPATDSNPTTSFASEEFSPGPIAYWKFDDGQGNIASNSANTNYIGALSGTTAPAWKTEDQCVSGKCLYFNGITSNVSVASISGQVQTVSFWVKPATSSASLLQLNTTPGSDIYASSGTVLTDNITTPTAYVNAVQNGTLVANQWNHVEVTTPKGIIASAPILGKLWRGVLNGYMDEVKFYYYARSPTQVKADFTSRGSAKGANVLGIGTNNQYSALLNGLVGYWKMDEATWSGTLNEVVDSSGNGNNGTAQGPTNSKAYSGSPGKFGNAGQFDGVDNYVSANGISIGTNSFTLSAWIKTASAANYQSIISYEGTIRFRFQVSGGALDYGIYPSGGPFVEKNDSGYDLRDNKWHHVAVTFNRSGLATSYVDGIAKGTLDISSASGVNLTGWPTNIGFDSWTASSYFPGSIDDVRIYNRALSTTDVQNLYNYAPGPVAYYNFEEGSGGTVYDRSGYGNNGSWAGTLGSQWTQGKYGWGGNFNGTDNYIDTGSNAMVNNITGPITVSTWINYTGAVAKGVVSKFEWSTGNHRSWQLNCVSTYCSFNVSPDGTSTNQVTLNSAGTLNYNQWYYITAEYTGSQLQFYINGQLSGTTNYSSGLYKGTNDVTIGSNNISEQFLQGKLDQVKIYNYAISQKQIIQDMNGGASTVGGSGNRSAPVGYWKFDEGYGTTANNSGNGGAGLSGTLMGTTKPTWNQNGEFGKALTFDGTSSFVGIPNSVGLNTLGSTFTISTWVKTTQKTNYATVFNSEDNANNGWQMIAVNGDAGAWCTGSGNYDSGKSVADGKWHYWANVYTGGNVTIYVDGNLINTYSCTPTNTSNNDTIGVESDLSNYSILDNYFQGQIDEVKVYSYPLTSQEIRMDYNHGSGTVLGAYSNTLTQSLVGYWKMDECSGTTLSDSSGNGNTGTITIGTGGGSGHQDSAGTCTDGTGNTAWNNGRVGKFNSSLNFDGIDDYVDVPSANFFSQSMTAVTVSAWVYPKTLNTYNNVVYQSNFPITGKNGWLLFVDNTGVANFDVNQGTSQTSASSNAGAVPLNNWSLVTGSYDGNNIKIYVNGILKKSVALSSVTFNPITDMNIGGATNYFTGQIDDVRIYNRALSLDEIQALYGNSQTGFSNAGMYCVPGDSSMCNPPVGEWNFEDGPSSPTVQDTSGNGYYGTWNTPGKQDFVQALSKGWAGNFNGALGGNYLTLNSPTILQNATGALSVSAWIKFPSTAINTTNVLGILTRDSDWGLTLQNATATGSVCTAWPNYSIDFYTHSVDHCDSAILYPNTWYYISAVYNPSALTISLYINGALSSVNSTNVPGSLTTLSTLVELGALGTGSPWENFNGQIDQVRAYTYVRTPAQIAWDYNKGKPVGWWKFDECQGTILHDSSGNGNSGILTPGTPGIGTCTDGTGTTDWSKGVVGKFNSSMYFDGSTTYASVSNSYPSYPGISLSYWFNASPGWQNWAVQVLAYNGSSSQNAAYCQFNATNNLYCLVENTSNQTYSLTSSSAIVANQWYHVALTYDGSYVRLYLNGKLNATPLAMGGAVHSFDHVWFGSTTGGSLNFGGKIDDVRIYDYALTPLQVNLLLNDGAAVLFAPLTGTP